MEIFSRGCHGSEMVCVVDRSLLEHLGLRQCNNFCAEGTDRAGNQAEDIVCNELLLLPVDIDMRKRPLPGSERQTL